LARAILEGKITEKTVTQAKAEVKRDLGGSAKGLSQEDLDALLEQKLEQKLREHTDKFSRELSGIEERRSFENQVKDFIDGTSDFDVYADAIDKWLDEHPDQSDIKVAYTAVKGLEALANAKKSLDSRAAEESKKMAANAGGGSGMTAGVIRDKSLIDELIGGRVDPNRF
jgi:hypothetical protein